MEVIFYKPLIFIVFKNHNVQVIKNLCYVIAIILLTRLAIYFELTMVTADATIV